MSAPMWNAAVPAGQYPEHSWPRIVRHGNAAPSRPSWSGPLACEPERGVAPAKRVGGRPRRRVGQHRQNEALGVPEGVAVVAGAGEAFRPDRALLGAGAGLERVEEREADRLLQLEVAVQLDVGALPEVVQIGALRLEQALPARVPRLGERGDGQVSDGRQGPLARGTVRQELDDLQALSGSEISGDRDSAHVGRGLGRGLRVVGPVNEVIHRGGQAQLAQPGRVHEDDPVLVGRVLLGLQRRVQRRGCARVRGSGRRRLIGDELGLDHHAHRPVQGLDLEQDRRGGALGERDESRRPHANSVAGGRHPFDGAAEDAVPKVELALVQAELAVADVEGLVIDEQADDLAVGDVHERLTGLRVAVAGLRVRQRAQLVEGVQVRAGQAERLALVEIRPQPDVPVREGEHRFGLGERVEVELRLAHRPGLDGESGPAAHRRSSSSDRSETTRSAPARRSASA